MIDKALLSEVSVSNSSTSASPPIAVEAVQVQQSVRIASYCLLIC